ncbi:MAG: ABC transporter ATP-binding protein [Thermoplasmata archaeon]|nr:ABC transporter ATP-binding protein [Thermoplasmata archaeon]
MTVPSIETRGLTRKFGSFTALDHLDLKVEGGKCVGFLGPNGSGKTTTLKLLTAMIYPTEGECYINDIPCHTDRTAALAGAGVLIESPEIYPSLTPNEALEMVEDVRGIPRDEWKGRIETVLAEVRMSDWADKKVGKFSKGMKQRVNIAAALVHDPPVVLLDEPSTGLDPRGMSEVRAILRALKQTHRLIFMSSHLLSEVTEVCDEVALLDHGKLRFYDTLPNVVSRFGKDQGSVDVTFDHPVDPAAVRRISGIPSDVTDITPLGTSQVRIKFSGPSASKKLLLRILVDADLGVVGFVESESALEEIYLSQISRGE